MSSSGDHESGSGAERIPPRCSFCRKIPDDGVTLIEGPILEGSLRAYICRDCVELCAAMLDMERMRGEWEPLGEATREWLRERLDQVLETLSGPEREVITLRYGLEDGYSSTRDEVARRLGIAPLRVAEIEAQAVAKLRSRGSQPAS
jgi:RNA polymerase sigma factor (sigma-70 family)